MVIDALYRKYFQKSKIFLYPLLDIKRGTSIVPDETYLGWNETYSPEDKKLICVYTAKKDKEYILFESNTLLKHNRLVDYVRIGDETTVFTFDFSDIEEDWSCFVKGKYSQISMNTKRKIVDFFDKNSGNYAYVNSYLFPEKHFETYAQLLDVDVDFLKSVGELCTKPDFEKEMLLIKVSDLENLKILD